MRGAARSHGTRLFAAATVFAVASLPVAGPCPAAWAGGGDAKAAGELISFNRAPGVRVLDRNGNLLAIDGANYGRVVPRKELPKHLVDALISTEDRRFFSHNGIDPRAIARAAMKNLMNLRVVEGASTISQQVVKNVYFPKAERTVWEKLKETEMALEIEQSLSKDEILFVYFNRVYFGKGAWGIEAAAQTYFGKPAKALSVYESALLVGSLRAPSRWNVIQNPEKARANADRVIDKMVEEERLTPAAAKRAKQEKVKVVQPRRATAPYFVQWVVAETKPLRADVGGTATLKTTLDPRLQRIAEAQLEKALATEGKRANASQGAAVVMTPDGEILAMVGGRDYRTSQVNRALAIRQPGSAFKLFVFLDALERGLKPTDRVLDEPIRNKTIRNFNNSYRGEITLAEALAYSSNVAAVRLADGRDASIIKLARRLGVTSPLAAGDRLALGTNGMRLLELTAAYAALPGNGNRVAPTAAVELRDETGRIILRQQPPEPAERVLQPKIAKAMRAMLNGVITMEEGTGRLIRPIPFWAAGKTGTSNDYRDALFVGFSEQYVVGVWLGNDDNERMKSVTGGGLPVKIWKGIMVDAVNRQSRVAGFQNNAAPSAIAYGSDATR
jgi:penicillin-binding protein 1A